VYVGEYENDKKHGEGTMIYSNGDKYVGSFDFDKKQIEFRNFQDKIKIWHSIQRIQKRSIFLGNNKNNGVILPVEDNNKNLLMIVGAFLVGYLLFNNDTPTT
jgi:hypothetical protein